MRDKLIGTLVVPGGLATAVFALARHGIDPLITLGGLLVLVALPVVTSIYMARRMRSLRSA